MQNKIEILREISRSIQRVDDPGIDYLGQKDILSAVAPDPFTVLFVNKYILQSLEQVKVHLYARYLNEILERCKIISFADWANLDGVSDLWEHFRAKVIKPMGRHDFEFIFNMGNTANKPPYEVDEILDIIGDFSLYGNVTLILTARDATKLWSIITGQQSDSSTPSNDEEKGRHIFNSMNISRLLVYSPEHRITIFSKGGQQEWMDSDVNLQNVKRPGREMFNVGFIMGLLLQLQTIHCAALGLTLSEAFLQNEEISDLRSLLARIDDRIDHLDHELVAN